MIKYMKFIICFNSTCTLQLESFSLNLINWIMKVYNDNKK